MTKLKTVSSQQKKALLHLLQFLIQILFTSCSTLSARIFADAFVIFLIYRSIEFSLRPVSSRLFQKVVFHSSELFEDTNRYVVINEDLCRFLSLSNFDWVLLMFDGSAKKYFQVISSRVVKHLEIVVTNDTALSILSQLKSPNVKVKFVGKAANFSPKTAKKATIQLLEKFNNPNVKIVDDILYSYFSHPRFIRKNDVFSVGVKQHFPEKFYSIKHFRTGDIQCRVVDVFGDLYPNDLDSYLVTNRDTSLIQLSNYQGYLPLEKFQEYVWCGDSESEFNTALRPLHPEGFDEYFSQILLWCNLFIQNNQNDLQLLPFFLISGAEGSGKSMLLENAAKFLGIQYFKTDCAFLQTPTPGYADAQLKNLFAKFKKCPPCLVHFSNFEAFCVNSNGTKDDRLVSSFTNHFYELKNDWPILIFATAQNSDEISGTIARLFLESVEIKPLNQAQRKTVLSWASEQQGLSINPASLESLSKQTTGFLFADLISLIDQTILNLHKTLLLNDARIRTLKLEDFEEAFKKIQSAHASSIGAPQIPAVSWDDVGGLGSLKQEILKSLSALPFSNNLRRSGLLLHGPPGTGKTLIAKAIATECNFNFLSVKGPELLNMYVGQSEQNVREVFARARSASPCVVFFDELDSLAPNRGKNGDSGGVMDRVVSQLLAEMDEVQKSEGIFVLAATNRPDLIDPALLRPGRLDKLLYVGPCEDKESKLHILKAVTRKYNLSEDANLENIACNISGKVTGADISAICSTAWLNAARHLIAQHESQGNVSKAPLNKPVIVTKEDFLQSIKAVQ